MALSTSAFAASITGTVTNKTTNKPAAGDDVVLIRLAQGMQEATRTKTDSHGRFTLDVPEEGLHLVRVTHDKANYFRPAPPGTQSVEIEVYNAAAHVNGISREADMIRIESDPSGNGLHIVENFFVKNESTPPMTQFSDRPFEFYLPAGAVVEGSAALAPGGMPVQAAPVPLSDEPNHYAFIFPVRPGETRFQITYKLPYSGSFKFAPRLVVPTDAFLVMMPKSMKFVGGQSTSFSPVTEETAAQTFVARNVQPSEPIEFTVSGTGQMPRDAGAGASSTASTTDSQNSGAQPAQGTAATDTRPGGGLGNPIDPEGTNDPWAKYKWWILGGLGLALAGGAGILLKNSAPNDAGTATSNMAALPGSGPNTLLQTLKEELFAVETDRLQGKLSDAQYAELKGALEIVLRRALIRVEGAAGASNLQGPATATEPEIG
ncbi:carboxypeptidase-like regulatory domain-containing protein [Granulicella arctica]|uniref:5-hydroxyisourate hydrolase-like protein (Transthyretin family) n=1 Tax=Granulicella arctica TaxID=940613 RepID=A0A7Y9PIW7_9BACT|nr:carboxypeptidase-like regulatory domain-containing protein [Granulicella arctica]NYF80734.1 5-hydroxyisourate hydrolase-like protein (transthyretin family) [Granulicella arctica]